MNGLTNDLMGVAVSTLTGPTFMILVSPNETIAALKVAIEAQEGIPVPQQRPILAGSVLEDSRIVRETELTRHTAVQLVVTGMHEQLHDDLRLVQLRKWFEDTGVYNGADIIAELGLTDVGNYPRHVHPISSVRLI